MIKVDHIATRWMERLSDREPQARVKLLCGSGAVPKYLIMSRKEMVELMEVLEGLLQNVPPVKTVENV